MTSKEAIKILQPLTEYIADENGIATWHMINTLSQIEALNLAIKALEGADDVCEKCKYVDRSVREFPCNECVYAYENHFTELK